MDTLDQNLEQFNAAMEELQAETNSMFTFPLPIFELLVVILLLIIAVCLVIITYFYVKSQRGNDRSSRNGVVMNAVHKADTVIPEEETNASSTLSSLQTMRPTDALRALKQSLDSGEITMAEFQKLKQQILNRDME